MKKVQLGISLISLLVAACSGTGRIDVGVSASSALEAEGDEPPAAAPKLLVTVARVQAHIGDDDDDDGDDEGEDDATKPGDGEDDGDGGWVTLFEGPTEIDLASALSAEAFLGGADVPPGKVTQVRLILAGDAVLVDGETRTTIACPSCTQTGIKIVTRGNLSVAEGEQLHLNVVFDTVASVVLELDGLRLRPVVRLEKVAEVEAE